MADMLATPADLASLLQEDVDTATATLLLETATGLIQSVVGQRIIQVVNDTVTLDIPPDMRSQWLHLPEGPVTAVSSILVGTAPVTDYALASQRGEIWRVAGWRTASVVSAYAPSTVTVTYTHGYAPGDERLQLARSAALWLARAAYANPNAAVREQVDDYAVQYDAAVSGGLTPELMVALQRRYGCRGGNSVPLIAR